MADAFPSPYVPQPPATPAAGEPVPDLAPVAAAPTPAVPMEPVKVEAARPARKGWRFWAWILLAPALLLLAIMLAKNIYELWHQSAGALTDWVAIRDRLKGRIRIADTDAKALETHAAIVWTIVLKMVVMGVVAALAAGGDIALLNRLRGEKRFCRWYFRMPISLVKRLLLVLQLATVGAALYALGVYYLGIKVISI